MIWNGKKPTENKSPNLQSLLAAYGFDFAVHLLFWFWPCPHLHGYFLKYNFFFEFWPHTHGYIWYFWLLEKSFQEEVTQNLCFSFNVWIGWMTFLETMTLTSKFASWLGLTSVCMWLHWQMWPCLKRHWCTCGPSCFSAAAAAGSCFHQILIALTNPTVHYLQTNQCELIIKCGFSSERDVSLESWCTETELRAEYI